MAINKTHHWWGNTRQSGCSLNIPSLGAQNTWMPHSSPVRARYGGLFWVHSLIDILAFPWLSWMQYGDILRVLQSDLTASSMSAEALAPCITRQSADMDGFMRKTHHSTIYVMTSYVLCKEVVVCFRRGCIRLCGVILSRNHIGN